MEHSSVSRRAAQPLGAPMQAFPDGASRARTGDLLLAKRRARYTLTPALGPERAHYFQRHMSAPARIRTWDLRIRRLLFAAPFGSLEPFVIKLSSLGWGPIRLLGDRLRDTFCRDSTPWRRRLLRMGWAMPCRFGSPSGHSRRERSGVARRAAYGRRDRAAMSCDRTPPPRKRTGRPC